MQFQLSWETAPGLAGLRCEGFRALPAEQPDAVAGVTMDCAGRAEAERLATALETYFAPKRFSNAAAAFEAVKAFVVEWEGDRVE
ncbi:MAG TPA: hypothetical protein VGS20_06790 [Candidatus Acidoferrales bacterium]|nr:hypothetical protein [Candidatus Acidoferrales bacterium]